MPIYSVIRAWLSAEAGTDRCNSRAFLHFDTGIYFIFMSIVCFYVWVCVCFSPFEVDNLCVDGSSRSSVLPWAESKQQWRWLPDVTPAKKDARSRTHLLALNPEAGEGRGPFWNGAHPTLAALDQSVCSPRHLGRLRISGIYSRYFWRILPIHNFCGLLSLRASLLERALFTRHIFIFFYAGRLLPTFRFFNRSLLCDCLVNKQIPPPLFLFRKNAFDLVLE